MSLRRWMGSAGPLWRNRRIRISAVAFAGAGLVIPLTLGAGATGAGAASSAINPNGILFGAGARVDVGGLIASTTNIRNDDFLNGKGQYKFSEPSTSPNATVVNNGTINAEGGIVAPVGKPGGVLMFHGNLVHGSSGNITPYPRKIVYLTLNAVSNYIRTPTRPDYIAHRDFAAIQTVDDDALVRLARAQREAAE